jgi:ATP-grasp domain
MVADGVEMVVGGLNDLLLGPVIMAGTGAIFVELLGDTAFRMCPLTETEAAALVEDVKANCCREAIAVHRQPMKQRFEICCWPCHNFWICPEIEEMDLNPVMVRRKGAEVVDARIKVGVPPKTHRSRRVSY